MAKRPGKRMQYLLNRRKLSNIIVKNLNQQCNIRIAMGQRSYLRSSIIVGRVKHWIRNKFFPDPKPTFISKSLVAIFWDKNNFEFHFTRIFKQIFYLHGRIRSDSELSWQIRKSFCLRISFRILFTPFDMMNCTIWHTLIGTYWNKKFYIHGMLPYIFIPIINNFTFFLVCQVLELVPESNTNHSGTATLILHVPDKVRVSRAWQSSRWARRRWASSWWTQSADRSVSAGSSSLAPQQQTWTNQTLFKRKFRK